MSRGRAGLVPTGAVEVYGQAVPHVFLDQLQRALEDLPRTCLLHGVRVPRVAEQGQQVVGGAWPAADRDNGDGHEDENHSVQ